uniref:G-protein coupled receptors family 1 profile domain-containing protein n=1 Tax=Strongyloides venezuelensis TaxID=75913 RepID=A0A0K0F399_STRVS
MTHCAAVLKILQLRWILEDKINYIPVTIGSHVESICYITNGVNLFISVLWILNNFLSLNIITKTLRYAINRTFRPRVAYNKLFREVNAYNVRAFSINY